MYEIVREAEEVLMKEKDAKGRSFIIHKIELPKPLYITEEEAAGVDPVNGMLPRFSGDRLIASYVSYYTANGGIIFPLFEDPNDKKAELLLKKIYPEHEIIGVWLVKFYLVEEIFTVLLKEYLNKKGEIGNGFF